MNKKGIDISTWQKKVDWERVKASGVEFAMLRAGFGGTQDNMFEDHINGAASVGIPVGVYWFSYALNEEEARAEAAVCIDTIKRYNIAYPVAYDFEDKSVKNAAKAGVTMTRELVTAIIKAFLTEISAAGYTPLVYSNSDYLKRLVDMSKINAELWLAAWQDADPPMEDNSEKCRIWQYKVGTCDGVEGACDLNVWYEDKAPSGKTYTVKIGDTLWGIASRLLHNGFRYREIKTLNNQKSDYIHVGQVLKLPDDADMGSKQISVGSTVKITGANATYRNGKKIGSSVKEKNYKVDAVDGIYARLMPIYSWVRVDYLTVQ